MARHTSYVGTLTIASAGTNSNVLQIPMGKQMIGLTIAGPSALTGTVALNGNMTGHVSTVQPLALNGTAIEVAAAISNRIEFSGLQAVKAVSGSAEGAERVFTVYAEFDL